MTPKSRNDTTVVDSRENGSYQDEYRTRAQLSKASQLLYERDDP